MRPGTFVNLGHPITRVPWFPSLPEGWRRERLDNIASVRARIGWKALTADEYLPEGFVFLSTPNIKTDTIDFENVNYISAFRYEESPELQLHEGDVLLVKDGNTLGVANIVRSLPRPATVNGSIAVVRPRNIDSRFLCYFLSSQVTQALIQALKGGMGVPHLFQADLKGFPVPLPPRDMQVAIADSLDRETVRIEALIERKRTMQGLLIDRRSTVVDAALAATDSTKGWAHSRLKFLVGRATSGNRDHSFTPDEGGVPCLRGINVKPGRIVLQDLERMSVVDHERHGATRLRAGDVVIVRSGNAGVASVVPPELDDSNCVDLVIVRRSPQVDSKLVEVAINSSEARRQIELRRAAAALGHFNAEDVGELMVAVPESLAEQRRLVEELDLKTSVLDVLVEKLDGQVLLLTEHRQALITAAVTGQIEVSGEAA